MPSAHAQSGYRQRRTPRPRARKLPGWLATLALLLAEAFVIAVLVVTGIAMFARVHVASQTPVDLRAAAPFAVAALRERPEPRQVYGPPPVVQRVEQAPSPDIDRRIDDIRSAHEVRAGVSSGEIAGAVADSATPTRNVGAVHPPASATVEITAPPAAVTSAAVERADTTASVALARPERTRSEPPPPLQAPDPDAMASTIEGPDALTSVAPAARPEPTRTTSPPPAQSPAVAATAEPQRSEAVTPAGPMVASEIARPDPALPPAPTSEPASAPAQAARPALPAAGATEPEHAVAIGTPASSQAEGVDTTGSLRGKPTHATIPPATTSANADPAAQTEPSAHSEPSAKIAQPTKPPTFVRHMRHIRVAARRARPRPARPPLVPPGEPATQANNGFFSFKYFRPDSASGL